jgi:hypothetical protein
MVGEMITDEAERLNLRRLSVRVSVRRQRAAKRRLEVMLGDEDFAAFERLRGRLAAASGEPLAAAEVLRVAVREAAKA